MASDGREFNDTSIVILGGYDEEDDSGADSNDDEG